MNKELREMCNLLADEMGRLENRLKKELVGMGSEFDERLNKMEQRLESMQHDINACKLEKDTLEILMRWQEKQDKSLKERKARIEKMENRPFQAMG